MHRIMYLHDMYQKIISGVFFTFSPLKSETLFTTAITALITLSALHKWMDSTGPLFWRMLKGTL